MSRLRKTTLVGALGGLIAASALFLAAGSTAHHSTPATGHHSTTGAVIADCFGRGVKAPAEYVPACGDGNLVLKSLRWHGWGGASATATGVASANDCRPDCARGHFHRYSVNVVVDHRTGTGAQRSYRRLVITAGRNRPAGVPRVERIGLGAPTR
ncbi:MAG TPA: hypothetical protein VIX82_03885 [Solirubrobacteraceae bacterium]